MIIYVKAFFTKAGRDADVGAIGIMPVSTWVQFNAALRVYAQPPCYLAFKNSGGDDLGTRGHARALLLSSIRADVLRQLSKHGSQGNTADELAQIVGVPAKQLSTILNMLCGDDLIECTGGIWTLAKE